MIRATTNPNMRAISFRAGARPSVLVVDDSEENVEILSQLLNEDFDVSVALDGLSAIDLVSELKIDLVLLDVGMPGIDGYETCRRLKANPATADIPVIFVTAMLDLRDETRGFSVGASDYITKPFDPALVRARVGNYFALRKAKRALLRQRDQIEDDRQKRKGLEESRDEVLGMLTGELGAPLARIVAGAEQSPLGGPWGQPAPAPGGREILDAVSSIQDLLSTSLDLSRLQVGKLILDRRAHDMGALLRRAAESAGLGPDAVDADPVLAVVDGERLGRAVHHLITRSIRCRGGAASVRAKLQVAGAWLLVTLSDGACAPGASGSLFDEIYRAGAPDLGVSRVGLAFAELLFEAHGGGVSLLGQPGEPRALLAVLPLVPSPPRPELAPEHAAARAQVLLVADDPSRRESLTRSFVALGMRVGVGAPSPEQLVWDARAARQALVVIDEGCSTIDPGRLASEIGLAREPGGPCVVSLSPALVPADYLSAWSTRVEAALSEPWAPFPRALPAAMLAAFCARITGPTPGARPPSSG